MVPEKQKGRVYYRCKRITCPTKTIREDVIEAALTRELGRLQLNARAQKLALDAPTPENIVTVEEQINALHIQLKQLKEKELRLEDLVIDEAITIEAFKRKQVELQKIMASIEVKIDELPDLRTIQAEMQKMAELRKNLLYLYQNANRANRRVIIENVWPNRWVSGKEVHLEPYSWVEVLQSEQTLTCGDPQFDRGRTFRVLSELHSSICCS